MNHKINRSINPFIGLIYEKIDLKFKTLFKYRKHRKKVKRFIKDILECSPSLDILWKMADFIKLAEKIFFYDNSIKNTEIGLYSSKNYPVAQNGFRISTAECRVVIKLFSDVQKVCVEIERLKGEGGKISLSFTNGEWDNTPNQYDEMLLEQIIKIINSRIIVLFNYCYDLR